LRLGKAGYRNIVRPSLVFFAIYHPLIRDIQMINLTNTSDWLAGQIASIVDAQGKTKFEILGDNLGGKGLPLVAWKLKHQEIYDGKSRYPDQS
jgi:glutamate decarboxylase